MCVEEEEEEGEDGESGISFCCLDYNCLVVPCIYVLSLPLFFCDC